MGWRLGISERRDVMTMPGCHNLVCGTVLKEAGEVVRRRAPQGVNLATPSCGARAPPSLTTVEARVGTVEAGVLLCSKVAKSEGEIIGSP